MNRPNMNCSDDKDPTCIVKMLEDFRSSSASSRRTMSLMGGRKSIFPFGLQSQSTTKPTRLNFDDSFSQNESGPSKKMKLYEDSVDSSIDSSKVSESSVLASPWETRRMKAELTEARAQIASLEARMNQVNALRRESETVYEQEKSALQQTVDRDRIKIRELEQRLKTVRKREAEAREELDKLRNSQKQEKCVTDDRCEKLQIDNAQLKDRLAELEAHGEDKRVALERDLARTELEVANVRAELATAKQLAEELTADLRERRRELRQWETDKSKLLVASQRVKELESERESHLEAYNLAQAQQDKLMRVSELELEITQLTDDNKNLRQAISNTVYLEGLVEDLKAKVGQLDVIERECVSLRVELGLAQGRLEEWAALHRSVMGHSPVHGPAALRRYMESLQQRELTLTQEKAAAENALKAMKEAHSKKQKELTDTQTQLVNTKNALEVQTTKVRRLRKQLSLITWERDDLRNLVDSCQKEVTMTSVSLEPQPNSRVEALEKLVDGYRQRMEQLEANPGLAYIDNDGGFGSRVSSEKADALAAEKAALVKEKEALQKEVEELKIQMEYRSLKGDFDMRDCKIMHFRMNPTADAMQKQESELERCQRELTRLRERLKLLEEGQSAQDLTQIVDDRVTGTVAKEVEELKEKVKTHERQNQRLKEVFKSTSHEFREAVYQLFGYKVDGLANKIYRLSNVYSEAQDDHLLFKMSSLSGMELLETPYSATCAELIDTHLHQQHSIPVFLSALTMNLFQRQTLTSH